MQGQGCITMGVPMDPRTLPSTGGGGYSRAPQSKITAELSGLIPPPVTAPSRQEH